jgi:cupin 2 domain-containing protein
MKGVGNLFSPLPDTSAGEVFEALVEGGERLVRVERIVSRGQSTPPGEWYDQDWHEWVALLSGCAGLLMDGEDTPRVLGPGDHLTIPAHRRHRVEWTDPDGATVWLAVHYRA